MNEISQKMAGTGTQKDRLEVIEFDIEGKKIQAKMDREMIEYLNENENLKLDIINKLRSGAYAGASGNEIIITSPHARKRTDVAEPSGVEEQLNDSGKPLKKNEWNHAAIKALIELYGAAMGRLPNPFQLRTQNLWADIARMMRKKGFNVTDDGCDRKFRALKSVYRGRLRYAKEGGTTPDWEFFGPLSAVLEDEKTDQTLNNTLIAAHMDMLEEEDESTDTSTGGSDMEAEMTEAPDPNDPLGTNKTDKKSDKGVTQAIDAFRKAYVGIEKKKLKEMTSIKKILKRNSMFQSERNLLLNSLIDAIKNK